MDRESVTDHLAVGLVVLTGIHALRTFFAMVVWNIGEDRSPNELGLIAFGFWAIGLVGGYATRWMGPRREIRLGLLFAILYATGRFTTLPVLVAALGIAAAISWLWLFPVLLSRLAARATLTALMPGLAIGLAAQTGLQVALHGLDLPVLHGPVAGIGATILAGALLVVLNRLPPSDARPGTSAGWGVAALGPLLVLELTLLTNPGRIQVLSGADLVTSAAIIMLGLATTCALFALPVPRSVWLPAAMISVVILARPDWLRGAGVWLLALMQPAVMLATAAGITPRSGLRTRSVQGWFVLAALLLFVFLFLYYSRFGWAPLWPIMAGLAAIPGLLARPTPSPQAFRAGVAAVLVIAAGMAINVATDRRVTPVGTAAPTEVVVMTYNIHEAFNADGVPGPEAIARVIESSGADLVGLQEVGRGWNINGGPDLVAWLRWRLPQYRIVYAPMLGDLVGDVIASRYPIRDTGWLWYQQRRQRFHYGLMWALIPTQAGELLVVNTHFSPYRGFEEDRLRQADDLLAFCKSRLCTVIVGDFNAGPDEPAITRLKASGLVDVTERHGLGRAFTFASRDPSQRLDYIFSTQEIISLTASIPQTIASDHLPVVARMRLR